MANYKTIETINWFENLSEKDYRIVSKSKDFMIHLSKDGLSHLLGLQYMEMSNNTLPGKIILRNIKHFNTSDEEILGIISSKHGYSVSNKVKKRINTFKKFMENIDNAVIVEMTHPTTQIKSQYLAIQPENGVIRHLGIYHTGDFNVLLDYDIHALETFLIQRNDNYYHETNISESVEQILVFDECKNAWRAGSFDLEKDTVLKDVELSMQDEKYKEILTTAKDIIEPFEYNGFHFIGLRQFTNEESTHAQQDGDSYLVKDGMANIQGYSFEEFIQNDEHADLFFNLETRNVYTAGTECLYRWNISEEEVVKCLDNKIYEINDNKLQLQQLHKISL
jgi:hypothetical protein